MASDKEFVDELRRLVTRKKEHLRHEGFKAPKGCSDFKTVVIRERDGHDARVVAVRVDELLRLHKDPSVSVMMGLRQQEEWRISIAAVDGRPTEDGITPFAAFDRWKDASRAAIGRFDRKLNSLDTDDLEKCAADSVPVDAGRLNEIPNFSSDSEVPPTEQS